METLIEPASEFIRPLRELPPSLWALILLGVSFLPGHILRAPFYPWLRRYNQRHDRKVEKSLLYHLSKRARPIFPLLVFWMAQGLAQLSDSFDEFLQKITQALLIIVYGWILLNSINGLEDITYHYEEERGDWWRESGATLLPSAGLVGIAAQKSLADFLNGLQIAITQPIKIYDAIIVEGGWGNIKEFTFTCVRVKNWGKCWLILPIIYFVEKPFQNWTRTSSELVGAILRYVNYQVPLDLLWEQHTTILAEEQLGNEPTNVIQVVDTTDKAMVIRGLVSSTDVPNTPGLRCQVQEKLVQYLQQHRPDSIPQRRMAWEGQSSGNQDLQSLPAI